MEFVLIKPYFSKGQIVEVSHLEVHYMDGSSQRYFSPEPVKPPVPPVKQPRKNVGINLAAVRYWSSERVEAKLKDLQAELRLLTDQNQRLRQLIGSYNRDGEIALTIRAIAEARLLEEDELKPNIVWKTPPYWFSHGIPEFVFVKKTSKRIHVRRRGESQTRYYNSDGVGRHATDGVIDLEASFI